MKRLYNKDATRELIFRTDTLIKHHFNLYFATETRQVIINKSKTEKIVIPEFICFTIETKEAIINKPKIEKAFISEFKRILKNNPDPNITYKNNISPFIVTTALLKSEEIVKMFIDLGVNVNTQNKFGRTALQESIKMKDKIITILLLNSGANKDLKNNDGKTIYDIPTSIEINLLLNSILQNEIEYLRKNVEKLNLEPNKENLKKQLKIFDEKITNQEKIQEEIIKLINQKSL